MKKLTSDRATCRFLSSQSCCKYQVPSLPTYLPTYLPRYNTSTDAFEAHRPPVISLPHPWPALRTRFLFIQSLKKALALTMNANLSL